MNDIIQELIPIEDDRLELYKSLYITKETLLRQCLQQETEYIRLFGSRMIELFEIQIQCIARKKEIALYVACYNRGEVPDPQKIEAQLNEILADYRAELEDMKAETEAAKGAKPVSTANRLKIRRLYRDLVFRLHPDLHPEMESKPGFSELWEQINAAFQCMDLEMLEDCALRAALFLEDEKEIQISELDLDQKIEKLREEIEEIKQRESYQCGEWIENEELVKEKGKEFDDQIEALKAYLAQLDQNLEELIIEHDRNVLMN